MSGKNIAKSSSVPKLELLVSREVATSKIAEQMQKGEKIKQYSFQSQAELDVAKNEYYKWSSYNQELLKQLFTNESIFEEYSHWFGFLGRSPKSLQDKIVDFLKDVDEKIHRLDSIKDRIELIPVSVLANSSSQNMPRKNSMRETNTKVFVVHGHDEAAREAVARFLEKLDFEAIILNEQASGGKTVIEKLESNSDVGFAIVLLTPDDLGAVKSDSGNLKPRARQNVILELGYFFAKLGRERVCALIKDSVEQPSDFSGIVYIPMDSAGAWKYAIGKELKAASFSVDMNNIA